MSEYEGAHWGDDDVFASLSCLSANGGDDDARTLGDRRGAIYDRLIKLNDAHFSVGTANFYMGHTQVTTLCGV